MDGLRFADQWRHKASGVFKPLDVFNIWLRNISGTDSSRNNSMAMVLQGINMGFADLDNRIYQWIDTISDSWCSSLVLYRQVSCEWHDYTCIRSRMVCSRNGV